METLRVVALCLVAVGAAPLVHAALGTNALELQTLGARGQSRSMALERLAALRLIDPLLRWLARGIARLPLGDARTKLDAALMSSGDPLGLRPDELIALSAITGCAGAGLGSLLGDSLGLGGFAPVLGAVLGVVAPYSRVDAAAAAYGKQVSRALPDAIDLVSLCMNAGLDFAGALRMLCAEAPGDDDPLRREIGLVLHGLQLGRTRKQTLLELAERVPEEAVVDFVHAVLHADQKGTPLATVLSLQAGSLRLRRSVRAEEAAARAAALLSLPLLLLVASILVVLLGPLAIAGVAL